MMSSTLLMAKMLTKATDDVKSSLPPFHPKPSTSSQNSKKSHDMEELMQLCMSNSSEEENLTIS